MKRAGSGSHIAPAACLAILLASCAAPLRYATPVDPLAVLPRDATVYLRLGRGPLGDLAPALLGSLGPSAASSKYLRSMLERTETLAVAAFPAPPDAGQARPGSLPRLEAVLMGDYPYRSAAFALRQDRQWKKDGRGRALVSTAQGLGLSLAGRDIVLVTSEGGPGPGDAAAAGAAGAERGAAIEGSIEALVDRLLAPGASVVPARLSALCDNSDIVVWAPDPFGKLAAGLLGGEAAGDIDIPAVGVLLAAKRLADGEEASYELAVVFLMRNEEDARTFRPAIRLAWYGLSRSLLPDEAGAASLRFELSGDAVAAAGLRLKASSIASALSLVARNAR